MQHATEQRNFGTFTYNIECRWTKQGKRVELMLGEQHE